MERSLRAKLEIISENRVNFTSAEAADGTQVTIEGRIPKKRNPLTVTGEYMLRAINGSKVGKHDLYLSTGTVSAGIPS